jgi:hypothetical protein
MTNSCMSTEIVENLTKHAGLVQSEHHHHLS